MNRRHPRVEFFFQSAGQKTNIGTTHWHQWAVHREALKAAMFDNLFQTGSDSHHCFAGTSATVEGDNRNGRVKQQL